MKHPATASTSPLVNIHWSIPVAAHDRFDFGDLWLVIIVINLVEDFLLSHESEVSERKAGRNKLE
jgi:hypothetical protein